MSSTPIRVCFVERQLEDAERLVSLLRNAGLPVRPSHVSDIEALTDMVSNEPLDLVVVSLPGVMELDQVVEPIGRAGKDIAIIALLAEHGPEQRNQAFELGATAVEPPHPPLIIAAVKREFAQLGIRRDVRRLEAGLRESERRSDVLLDSSRDPIAFVHEGMHVRANRAYLEMFGFESFEDIEGQSLLDLVAATDTDRIKKVLKQIGKGEPPPDHLELNLRRSDSNAFPGRMEFSEATYGGEACIQIVIRNPQEDPALAQELTRLKERDLVTDFYNRTHFTSLLDKTSVDAASGKRNHALLLLDIDNFDAVAGSVGVNHSDRLLADIAKVVAGMLEPTDIAARFGDRSFAILRASPNLEPARELAERLRQRIGDHIFDAGSSSLSLTFSIGGALICEKLSNIQTVLRHATEAATNAHAQGGNRVMLYDPYEEEQAEASRNAHWLKLVEEALEKDDGFVLFFQPMVALQGVEGEYFEALLRMNSPRGEILPNFFLPAAQQAGLQTRVDRWVVARAIAELARTDKKSTTFFVSVGADTLEDATFATWLTDELNRKNVPGKRLVLQAAESEVATQVKPLQNLLNRLASLHVGFTIKNFGAGLASFQLLKHIPAQFLKIDQNYLADFAGNTDFQKRVQEICDKAHVNHMKVIAPHVADMASVSVLYQCGVSFVQGNFLHEPAKSTVSRAA